MDTLTWELWILEESDLAIWFSVIWILVLMELVVMGYIVATMTRFRLTDG